MQLFIKGSKNLRTKIFLLVRKLTLTKVGFTTLAFVGIFLEKAVDVNFAIKKLNKIKEITECHYTTGDWIYS